MAHTGVHIVADPVRIRVGCARSTTHAKGVELIAITVAVSGGNFRAATVVDGAGTIADPAGVEFAETFVVRVADAISIGVGRAVPAADADGIELIAIAVAIPSRDVRTAAFEDGARSAADTTGIERQTF